MSHDVTSRAARARSERRRRKMLAQARGSHTRQEWAAMVLSVGGACCKCGDVPQLSRTRHCISLHKGHIVPISREDLEPSDAIENIQPLCWLCNTHSRNRDTTDYRPSDWRERMMAHMEGGAR